MGKEYGSTWQDRKAGNGIFVSRVHAQEGRTSLRLNPTGTGGSAIVPTQGGAADFIWYKPTQDRILIDPQFPIDILALVGPGRYCDQ